MNRVRSIFLAPVTDVAVQVEIAGSAGDVLPQLPPGQSLGIALGIPTVPNLRDLGGYRPRTAPSWRAGLPTAPTPSTR
jgi:hypothetical protein